MNAPDPIAEINAIVARARMAQQSYETNGSQARYDRAALAAAWAIMEPARNRELAELAVKTTGLGNVPDKITKNHRKTLGLMRDIKTAATYGVVKDDHATGITEIARPFGVVGAIVPSTNPGATPANNIINALKCGNAIIVAPSPKGIETCERDPSVDGERRQSDLHRLTKQRAPRANLRHACGRSRGRQRDRDCG